MKQLFMSVLFMVKVGHRNIDVMEKQFMKSKVEPNEVRFYN